MSVVNAFPIVWNWKEVADKVNFRESQVNKEH